MSSLSKLRASAAVESVNPHAISLCPAISAPKAAPVTPIELFPVPAATPATAVPCPSQEFGSGSGSSPHQS